MIEASGYPEVKKLTDFNLVLSCIDDKNFSSVEQIIDAFKTLVDIEDDEGVRSFFLKNCRRVLGEAILEGWIEAEPGT